MKRGHVVVVVTAVVALLALVVVVTWKAGGSMFGRPNQNDLHARIEAIDGVVDTRIVVAHPGAPWNTEIRGSVLCDVAPKDAPSVIAKVLLVVVDSGLSDAAFVEVFFYSGSEYAPTLKEMNSLFGEGDLDSLGLSAVGEGTRLVVVPDSGGIGANGVGLKEWAEGYRARSGD